MHKAGSQNDGKKEKGKEKTLQEKLKGFFGLSNTSKCNQQSPHWQPKVQEESLSADIIAELAPENPTQMRIKAMSHLYETVLTRRLEDNALLGLVNNTYDLVSSSYTEARHTVLIFYKNIIQGQFEKLTAVRAFFFSLIRSLVNPEDTVQRMELLKVLTQNGKKIMYFEDEMGPFLWEWSPVVFSTNKTQDFLSLLINFIKYNAAYLDLPVTAGIVIETCQLATKSKSKEEIKLCLEILDALICYSSLPSDVLPYFIISLCKVVNIETLSYSSWKVMKNFLGTSMGLSGIFVMCTLIQDSSYRADYSLLRGAIYFIGTSLWGSKLQRVSSLRPLPTAILPSLLQALSCPNSYVAYEVVQCIHHLISSDVLELKESMWEQILNIMHVLMGYEEVISASHNNILSTCVHNVLSKIESMSRENSFQGSEKQLYRIIEEYSHLRPETSVMRLIEYHAQSVDPKESDWIERLNRMMDNYFKDEKRTCLRVKVLDILFRIMADYRQLYEEKLIDQTILQFISNIETEPDIHVRKKAVQLLVEVALNCHTIRCFDILDIIKKVLLHHLEETQLPSGAKDLAGSVNVLSEDEVADICVAATGLVKIFKHKLLLGFPKHVIHVYLILLNYLEDYYRCGVEIREASVVRKIIFQLFLSLRANGYGLLGFVDDKGILKISCNLMCAAKNATNQPCSSTGSPPVLSPTGTGGSSIAMCDLCINPVFQVFIRCLKEEHDWNTMKLVLQELPGILRNKALVICARGSITQLCTSLTSLVMNTKSGAPENLYNAPPRFNRSDFYLYIFPILSTLTAYHKDMGTHVHRVLIKCLEQGLKSKCQRVCISGLTLCTLEMQDVMYKLLPEVLLSLSKISATVPLAIPMLEFLSTLIRLPQLYMSFVGEQYLSIFAIALPYTNSFKFSHYTVALAHHVIAMWFLKCRLSFRKEFVNYIMSGLKSNVVTPFDEKTYAQTQNPTSEGVQRPRSGSLNDPTQSDLVRPPNIDMSMMNLHQELLETCHDLLSRYCFCTASTLPKRFHLTEFLTERGSSTSWLLGHTLVTITTSGPGNRAYRDSLCEQCYRLCAPQESEESQREASFGASYWSKAEDASRERKRHRSCIQPSTRELNRLDMTSKDDMQMGQRNADRFGLKSEAQSGFDLNTNQSSTSASQMTDSSAGTDTSRGVVSSSSICNCWCPGWAEVLIRRPTGNTSWLMRIQNSLFFPSSTPDFLVPDFANWFKHVQPDTQGKASDTKQEEQTLHTSPDNVAVRSEGRVSSDPQVIPYTERDDVCKTPGHDIHSPLRRTSSSPDVKGDWLLHSPRQHSEQQQSDHRVPPLSPPLSKNEHYTTRSSPSSPTSKLSSDFNEAVIDYPHKEMRSCLRMSPKKEDKHCKPIPEELETSVKSSNRPALTLDLSGVDNQPSKGPQRSTSPPQSAGPVLAGGKTTSGPKSPFFKRVGSASPPPSSPKASVPPVTMRDRGHTISVVSPSSQSRRSPIRSASFGARPMATPQRDIYRTGLSPSFVFLQLYHTHLSSICSDQPLLLPRNEAIDRAVNVLDHIPPYETHKIGVIYIGPDQANSESQILANRFGSLRYKEFLFGLGTFVRLKDVDPKLTYLGGLEQNGQDGDFACSWQDDIMQVIFHVATLMPNHESDLLRNNKKRHIGNNSVLIAYNCSSQEYDMSTVKGQLINVCIEIFPSDHQSNVVTVKAKKELGEVLSQSEPQLVSDDSLPIYVRQLALHANLASGIYQRQLSNRGDPKVTNWLERLRQLKRIRAKAMPKTPDDDLSTCDSPKQLEDFTAYV